MRDLLRYAVPLALVATILGLAGAVPASRPKADGWLGPPVVGPDVPVVPILMYHHVGDWGPPHPSWEDWVVRPADFAAQLDWLRAHGYRTVTFEEVLSAMARGERIAPKSIILTFDDGWDEHAHWLTSELTPRGMRGVLFVFTGAVAEHANGGGYISWDELRALEAAGHRVESHTVSHARLPTLTDDAVARELVESRAAIARGLGHDSRVLAYPYGAFDQRIALAACRAGYALAVRAEADPASGAAARLALPRLRMRYGEGVDVLERRLRDGLCVKSAY